MQFGRWDVAMISKVAPVESPPADFGCAVELIESGSAVEKVFLITYLTVARNTAAALKQRKRLRFDMFALHDRL